MRWAEVGGCVGCQATVKEAQSRVCCLRPACIPNQPRLSVAPPCLCAASCEVVAFSLGAMTSMPALRNFSSESGAVEAVFRNSTACRPGCCEQHSACSAWGSTPACPLQTATPCCAFPTPAVCVLCAAVCAALAVFLDFLLQVTAFVALLALDTRRLEQGRYDCWPCLR